MLSTPERPVRSSVLAILRAMPCKRLLSRARRTPSLTPSFDDSRMAWLLFECCASNARRDRQAAGGAPDCCGAGIDDDCGDRRFDDRRPLHAFVSLHRLETADARVDEAMAGEIGAAACVDRAGNRLRRERTRRFLA